MNTGLLILSAGELAVSTRELERWNPTTVSRKDARIVVGLLELGKNRNDVLLRKWKARLGEVQTVKMEAQDISAGDEIYFAKPEQIHVINDVSLSPCEPGWTRLSFGEPRFTLDVDPTEEFDVILSHN